ncbi:MAG: phosphotransferase [Myxococcota bacterium]|nr:phosphotransferase [Myxococcota bacterium]
MDDDRPTLDELHEQLRGPLSDSLPASSDTLQIEYLCQPKDVADDPAKLLVRDGESRKLSVVLVSAPADPGLVGRGMRIAAQTKARLGARLGDVILEPLGEGTIEGLSYVILPFCRPIGEGKVARRYWRLVLRRSVLDWLAEANASTLVEASAADVADSFELPLERMAESQLVDGALRRAANEALGRLKRGDWQPRFVFMHGDLWEDNLLLAPPSRAKGEGRGEYPFVVIDWPGATLRGYAMYDLIRLASSMRLRGRGLRREVLRHCEILGGEPEDAPGYLLAGLGHLSFNLGCFSPEVYLEMSRTCFNDLEAVLA